MQRGDKVDKSILIADDNIEIINILKPYIEKEGFSVNFCIGWRRSTVKV